MMLTTGHRGTLAGEVAAAGRDYLQFTTRLPLEVHDGLQVELSGETRPFGFAVEEIILPNGRRVFNVPAHSRVQVPLPPGAPRIPPGTTLFLASSQAVKRRYHFALPNPREWRRRYPVDIHVEFSADRLAATATLHADGGGLSTTVARPFAPAENPAGRHRGVAAGIHKLGDTPSAAAAHASRPGVFSADGAAQCFAPRVADADASAARSRRTVVASGAA